MTDVPPRDTTHGSADARPPEYPFSPPPGVPAPADNPQQTGYAPTPASVWDAPRIDASQQPRKRRRAWPWVLGVVGVLAALTGAGVAIVSGVDAMLHPEQNDNYTGSPIAAEDTPTRGNKLIVSDSGSVAFEVGRKWIDTDTLSGYYNNVAPSPDGAALVATYYAIDATTPDRFFPTVVQVFEGDPRGQVGPIDLAANHERFVAANVQGLRSPLAHATTSEARPMTTANGLDGLVTEVSSEYKGSWMNFHTYTFVRYQRIVHVEITTYTRAFDEPTAALVTDTLRIDP